MSIYDIYINKHKQFLLFWSPKSACTTLTEWFIASLDLKEDSEKTDITTVRVSGKYYCRFRDIQRLKHYKKIIFIRNPFTRIVSAFVQKFIIGYEGKKLDSLDKLEFFAREVAQDIYRYKGIDYKDYDGFTFIDFIDYIERKMSEKNNTLNHHWSPQTGESVTFDYVCKVEEISKDIDKLNKIFNISNFKTPVLNKGVYGNNIDYSNEKLFNIKTNEIMNFKFKFKFNYKNFYNHQLIERVKTIYKEDFALGGYTFD